MYGNVETVMAETIWRLNQELDPRHKGLSLSMSQELDPRCKDK